MTDTRTDEQKIRGVLDAVLAEAEGFNLPHQFAATRNALAALDRMVARIAELTTVYTDEDHVDWAPPTAWAYAQTCKALHAKEARIADLEGDLRALQLAFDSVAARL